MQCRPNPLTPSLKALGDDGRVGPDTGWLRSRGTKVLLPEVAFVNLGCNEVWVQLEEYDWLDLSVLEYILTTRPVY